MNKYKLINKTTGEEHICYMVVIDGWDYYISGNEIQVGDIVIELYVDGTIGLEQIDTLNDIDLLLQKKVIATNNPSIDIPKVVNEDEKIGVMAIRYSEKFASKSEIGYTLGFIAGYIESKETHPNSDDDMIDFYEWIMEEDPIGSTPEILQLWKEQRPKTLYYE